MCEDRPVPDSVVRDSEWLRTVVEIQQLCYRYALAVDSRDMDSLVRLFVADVKIGKGAAGREALKEWYTEALRTVGATVHFVGNHTVDVANETEADGVVYCREEIEDLTTGTWRAGMIQYWDRYRLVEGEWLFVRRRVRRWFATEPFTTGPAPGSGTGPTEAALPGAFPTWSAFWEVP
jgi:hypothetical protein